jgi:hypothetical protein
MGFSGAASQQTLMLRTGFQLPRNGIPIGHVNNNNNYIEQPIFVGFIKALLGLLGWECSFFIVL